MFAFFSRFIDLNTQYFMSDVCNSIINKIPLRTSEDNFFRDFIHSNDLAQIIELCVISKANASYDLYSKTPVSKWEIIDHCSKFFDMNYIKDSILNSPTGKKNNYFSLNHNAENIGYKPQYTSLDVISNELIKILGR
jgi:nucleoside-diphosphate-sugar epimerase